MVRQDLSHFDSSIDVQQNFIFVTVHEWHPYASAMKKKNMVAHRELSLLLVHTRIHSTRLQVRTFTSCAMHYYYSYNIRYVRSSVDRLIYLKRF